MGKNMDKVYGEVCESLRETPVVSPFWEGVAATLDWVKRTIEALDPSLSGPDDVPTSSVRLDFCRRHGMHHASFPGTRDAHPMPVTHLRCSIHRTAAKIVKASTEAGQGQECGICAYIAGNYDGLAVARYAVSDLNAGLDHIETLPE